ncbi:MAG: DUF1292 domain-containing protein [Clostridia bacterium]|nr:DUF1292 domain-containing protein [Clostridia bacterium]MBR2327916.1 DUF1292 domain-containing protein [Clostridia bacterium]
MADDIKNRFDEDEDFSPDLISLTDDDGNEQDFEVLDALELNGNTYIALIPINEDGSDNEDGEYVVLRVDTDEENNEEYYSTIDDDDEFDAVVAAFNEDLNGEYDLQN